MEPVDPPEPPPTEAPTRPPIPPASSTGPPAGPPLTQPQADPAAVVRAGPREAGWPRLVAAAAAGATFGVVATAAVAGWASGDSSDQAPEERSPVEGDGPGGYSQEEWQDLWADGGPPALPWGDADDLRAPEEDDSGTGEGGAEDGDDGWPGLSPDGGIPASPGGSGDLPEQPPADTQTRGS